MAGSRPSLSDYEENLSAARQAVSLAMTNMLNGLQGLLQYIDKKNPSENRDETMITLRKAAEELETTLKHQYNSNEELLRMNREIQKLPMLGENIPKQINSADLEKQIVSINDTIGKYNDAVKVLRSKTDPNDDPSASNLPRAKR